MTATIKPDTLVSFNTKPEAPTFKVLPAHLLEEDSLSLDLTLAGWRLAESYLGTGYRILVRPAGEPRWQSRYSAMVVPVEVREVETEVIFWENAFALVAALGGPIKAASNPITRSENIIHNA
tara:strand:+ start:511 stop:876 length:366 start_codon:yes stop_codon:yes gene_type:complete